MQGGFFLWGDIMATFYLNKKTGMTWQVDDAELSERLSKDENYQLVKPEVKQSEAENLVQKVEKPSNKK
jgi:hypothetical protein